VSTPDLSRRQALALLLAGVAVGGCADDDGAALSPTPSASGTPSTRTITHLAGTTEVPLNAARIVTLQDQTPCSRCWSSA